MRIMRTNLFDLAAATVTAGSEAADLPVANLQHPHRTKVYRTGTSAAAEWVKVDLGAAHAVQAVILLDHTLTAGDTLIKLQGNASDSWGAPSVDETLTYNAGTMAKFLSAAQTYQWWRIIFTKSAAGETRDIGRVFLGPYDEMEIAPAQPDGLQIAPQDLSVTQRSLGGQTYSDIKDQYDEITMEFPGALSETQSGNLASLAAACGTHTPFFVSVDPTYKPYDWLWYVKATDLTVRKVKQKKSATILWDATLKLAEEL